MLSKFKRLAVLALLPGILASCSEPLGTSAYLRSDQAVDGAYRFDLPLKDSLCVYDLWIYGRSCDAVLSNVELALEWESPSGLVLEETVFMRELPPKGSKELYRSEIRPLEYGTWSFTLRPSALQRGSIAGLGIVLDGTR